MENPQTVVFPEDGTADIKKRVWGPWATVGFGIVITVLLWGNSLQFPGLLVRTYILLGILVILAILFFIPFDRIGARPPKPEKKARPVKTARVRAVKKVRPKKARKKAVSREASYTRTIGSTASILFFIFLIGTHIIFLFI